MNFDQLHSRFTKLNTRKFDDGRRAPHKPLLALWAIGRCLRNQERMVLFEEARRPLVALLERFGPPRKTPHPEAPFWRLQKDGIWTVTAEGEISEKDLVGAMRRQKAKGGFLEEIYFALQDNPEWAVKIAHSLLDAYFPQTWHENVLQAVDIESGFEYVKRRSRNRAFSDKVLDAYDHQCVVCDFAMRMDDQYSIALEAAHIKWHCENGPDILSNALAFCVLHHRLFDVGAFTLSDERKIILSDHVKGTGWNETLGKFESREIHVPKNDADAPKLDYIEWHRDYVFTGELKRKQVEGSISSRLFTLRPSEGGEIRS